MGSDQPAAGLGVKHRAGRPSRVPAPWLALLAAPLSFGIAAPALVLADVAGATGTSVVAATWAVTAYGWGIAVGTPLMAGLLGRSGVRATLAVCGSLVLAGAVLVGVAPVAADTALFLAVVNFGIFYAAPTPPVRCPTATGRSRSACSTSATCSERRSGRPSSR